MPDDSSDALSAPGAADAQLELTLQPLVARGPAALGPDAETHVAGIVLSGTAVNWHNAFNEMTVRIADDLFACAARDGNYYDPLPKGGELVRATFDVLFEDAREPHWVEIIPPHTLRLQDPADAVRIVSLLTRRGFNTARMLALALLLTIAGLVPDAFCADGTCVDPDDDGPDATSAFSLASRSLAGR
jgi:hypothetical protein